MKKIVRVMCLAALLVGAGSTAQAQLRQAGYFNFGFLPTGGFSSAVSTGHSIPLTYKDMGKSAALGIGAGYRVTYRFDVGVGEVAPFAQADIFWNPISNDLSKEYTQARSASKPFYVNIPLQLGVTYRYNDLWTDIIPFAEAAIGPDILFIGSEGQCTYTDQNNQTVTTLKYKYKPTTSIAISGGMGVYLGEHVSVGAYYYWLGEHTISYRESTLGQMSTAEQTIYNTGAVETRTVGTLALRIGFHF